MVPNDDQETSDDGTLDVVPRRDGDVDDEVFRAMADRHRRFALYYLLEHSTVTVDELVDVVAGWVGTSEGDVVTADDRETVHTELVHCHLPILVEADLVELDRTTGEVSISSVPSTVRDLLTWAREHE